jgi:hypothetical protein
MHCFVQRAAPVHLGRIFSDEKKKMNVNDCKKTCSTRKNIPLKSLRARAIDIP